MTSKVTVILKQGSPLLSGDLYQLEAILGQESSGHGLGGGGEDIHFPFPGDKSRELSVNRSGRRLTISTARYAHSRWADIDLAELPDLMRERLVKILKENVDGPTPDELTGGMSKHGQEQ